MYFIRSIKAILLCLAASMANADNCDSLSSLQWLLGEWQSDKGNQITIESWKQLSQDTFEGVGKTVSTQEPKQDSIEYLRLVAMGNEVFFIAKVNHNTLPVAFKATHCTELAFTFENQAHDFPKVISYQYLNQKNLRVVVGSSDQKEKDRGDNSFAIDFKRLK